MASKKGYVLQKETSFYIEGEKVRTDTKRFVHSNFKKAKEDMEYCMSFLSAIDCWEKSFVGNAAIATHRGEDGCLDMAVTIMIISKGN